jgi:hypothetical protein
MAGFVADGSTIRVPGVDPGGAARLELGSFLREWATRFVFAWVIS